MSIRMIGNASMCGDSLFVSAKVRNTPGTKYPVIESVRIVKGIHQDLDGQDIEAEILLNIMKTTKYGTNCLGGNLEEGKYTPGSCKYEWLKRMVKDYVILDEVLTPCYYKLREISAHAKEIDALRYESL